MCCRRHLQLLAAVLTAAAWLLVAPAAQAQLPAVSIVLALQPSSIPADGSSTATATATVTDTVTGFGVPGETVVFTSTDTGEKISGTTDNGDGTYTATITSSTTIGTPMITATDQTAGISDQRTLTQTLGPPAHIALALLPSSIPADGASTSTATATVTDSAGHRVPGENVTFSSTDSGETISGTTDHSNGTYTATITSSRTPGLVTITASDGSLTPDSKLLYQGSGTWLSVLPSSTVSTNQPVTLIGAVGSSPTGTPPQGTVSFYNGFALIPGCQGLSVSPSGPISFCQTSFAASSSLANLTAQFTPSGGGSPQSSQTQLVSVVPGPTATSVRASTPAARVGIPLTYTAVVTPGNQGPVRPSGSVQFDAGGKAIRGCGNVHLGASGATAVASCTVKYSRSGTRHVMAVYSGDPNFSGSSSTAIQVPVQPRGVITATMEWIFAYTPSFTTITSLQLNGVSAGMSVLVSCKGQGCPFKRHMSTLRRGVRCTPTATHKCGGSAAPIKLGSAFHRHRLMIGSQFVVEIRRQGWIGKYYSFTIRSGRAPLIRISCLAPWLNKPGVGC